MISNISILGNENSEFIEMDDDYKLMFLTSEIVNGAFEFFKIERKSSKVGRPAFELKDMIKLILYGHVKKITSSKTLAYEAKFNELFIIISNGIKPSDRTIRHYYKYFEAIFQLIISFILILAHNVGLTDFKHISVDGTIKKAFNSPYNIFKEKDLSLLIKHYMVEDLTDDEIKGARKTVRKFILDESLTDEEKINVLFDLRKRLDYSGQDSIGLYDTDAMLMKTKDKGQLYSKLSYNIQLGTDTQSKLICGVNVVQNPTDHYQIPEILKQIITNLGLKPEKVSADTVYSTIANLQYLDELDITALIPTRQQNRKNIGKIPNNPFAKDYFIFDKYKNVFICPNDEILTPKGEYKAKQEKGGGNKTKIVYSNQEACVKCKYKDECYKGKKRTITRTVNELSYKTELLMSTEEGKEEYKLRSRTVEAHNGTFKRVFNYDHIPIIGLERVQNLMFTIVASYDIIRLYNLINEHNFDFEWIINEIKSLASS